MRIEDFMDSIGDYPTKTLRSLIDYLEVECKRREDERYEELVKGVCTSIEALLKEFPHAEFLGTVRCEECGYDTCVDVLSVMRHVGLTPDNFRKF
jgi:hypothetical protein